MRRLPDDLPLVFRGADAVAAGVLTPAQLRGPAVRRVVHGVYAPAAAERNHELRCAAVALLLPPSALITGRSAATLRGVEMAGWSDDVEVLVPEASRRALPRGVRVRRAEVLPPGQTWRGLPVLAPALRTAFDLAARVPLPDGVAALDRVVRAGWCDLGALRRWLLDVHCRDVVAVRAAAELCDPRAESEPESRLRVVCVQDGLDVVPQFRVRVGDAVLRLDLALPEDRVAIEYDGQWHQLRTQLERDRLRLRRLREADWEVVHVTADLMRRPDEVLAAIRSAVARQRRRARPAR